MPHVTTPAGFSRKSLRQQALSSAGCGVLALLFPAQTRSLLMFVVVALPVLLLFLVIVPGMMRLLEHTTSPDWTRRHGRTLSKLLLLLFALVLSGLLPFLNSTVPPLPMGHEERTAGVFLLVIGLGLGMPCLFSLRGRKENDGGRESLGKGCLAQALNPLVCGSVLLTIPASIPADPITGWVLALCLLGDGALGLARLRTLGPETESL